jgi:hypothetical protein
LSGDSTFEERLAAIQARRDRRIEKQRKVLEDIDERLGRLMTKRADAQDKLADLLRAKGTVML